MSIQSTSLRSFLAFALAGLAAHQDALAAGKKWVPLGEDGKEGKPPTIKLDAAKSSLQVSILDVEIHGFWLEEMKGPDGLLYQRVEVPGLAGVQQIGAPMLPALRTTLAVPTAAKEARLMKSVPLAKKSFPGILVWPQGTTEIDEKIDPEEDPGNGGPYGVPEKFVKDPAVYGLKTPWPATDGTPSTKVDAKLNSIPGAACECYPFKWTPSEQLLEVTSHLRLEYVHEGAELKEAKLTKDRVVTASKFFANWEVAKVKFIPDLYFYSARYLIVTPEAYHSALQPLIDQKSSHGFSVTVIHLEDITSTVAGIRAAIQSWYSKGSASMDHYCLLVGDTNKIPLGSQSGIPTDDLYGSPSDGDLCEEVYVGRLSVDGVTDVSNQVAKIVAYQQSPSLFGPYGKALLVAHKENAPGKYQGAQEAVRLAGYAVPPTFITAYGAQGATNDDVIDRVDAGLGLVCYRGHGDINIWWHWNNANEDFHKNDVIALANPTMRPVVWSFACTNQDLASGSGGSVDCIGETWLEMPTTGAVSHYGATVPSGTYENHELDFRMFEAVYDLGLVTQAHAIEYAEAKMKEAYPSGSNAWMYLLLGDPAMKIRRKAPLSFILEAPIAVNLCPIPGPPCDIGIKVSLPDGKPLTEGLVSLWKPSKVGGPDEVFTNTYTDSQGAVHLAAQAATGGTIHYSVRDDAGNIATGEIIVKDCTTPAANLVYGTGKKGTKGVPVLAALDLPILGTTSTIELSNGLPGALPTLILGAQAVALPFDKGTLLVNPQLILPLPVPIGLDGRLPITGTIPAVPSLCGVALYHQAWFKDPLAAGGYHLAITNGLKRTFGS